MRRILIAGQKISSYGLPWDNDTACYNFRAPDEFICAKDACGIGGRDEIETLVTACELPDYSFVSDMVNLRQLYIYQGGSITDISFIEGLLYLRQLMIDRSHIESLAPLARLIGEKTRLYRAKPDLDGILKYKFEGIYIQSDKFDCDPREFIDDNTEYTSDFIVNKHRMSLAALLEWSKNKFNSERQGAQ